MPIISMFYGIIIRLYLLDNKHHHLPHTSTRSTLNLRRPSVLEMARFSLVSCPASSCGWCRHGSSFTAMS